MFSGFFTLFKCFFISDFRDLPIRGIFVEQDTKKILDVESTQIAMGGGTGVQFYNFKLMQIENIFVFSYFILIILVATIRNSIRTNFIFSVNIETKTWARSCKDIFIMIG